MSYYLCLILLQTCYIVRSICRDSAAIQSFQHLFCFCLSSTLQNSQRLLFLTLLIVQVQVRSSIVRSVRGLGLVVQVVFYVAYLPESALIMNPQLSITSSSHNKQVLSKQVLFLFVFVSIEDFCLHTLKVSLLSFKHNLSLAECSIPQY